MADEVRVWQVTEDDDLTEIRTSRLNREERIERWITHDISVLEPHKSRLLVIGEQVLTDFGKRIDLLCIDTDGYLVIVELKRDKTPREVTAQALEYAAWVQDLGAKEIEGIAAEYFKNGETLKQRFEKAFPDEDFPDAINGDHAIKIVASTIDDSTERIVRYLSKKGIDINVVRFQMFQSEDGREQLIRTFTVPPDEAEQNARNSGGTKRTSPPKTLEVRLGECKNPAEVHFIRSQMSKGQETNRRNSALAYRCSARICWYVSPRTEYAHVVQIGRFAGDEQLWNKNLSDANVTYRRRDVDDANLGFVLRTKSDFDFFQHAMEHDAASFYWRTPEDGGVEPAEDEDN
jgi:hypothetical protein